MASDDIWILGIRMTKFGKHPDKDIVDLAAEAVQAALADGGVTMGDMGILAAGNLMGARRHRPADPEAGRPDRHPRLQRVQRLRHRRHRAAHGDHGRQGRRGDMGLAVGVEKLAGAGLLGGGGKAKDDAATSASRRSLRRGGPDRRPHRHRHHAGRVRPGRHGVRPQVRRHRLRAVRRHLREEPRPLDAQPAGRVPEALHARRDQERHDDRRTRTPGRCARPTATAPPPPWSSAAPSSRRCRSSSSAVR